jgi:GDPmannose 4,6-dehydratase
MWKMLQADSPDDYVIGSGTDVSVREFVKMAFEHVGLDWEKHVRFDERYLRPTEVDTLVADPSRAHQALNWKATISPKNLAEIMVDHDLLTIDKHMADAPTGQLWLEEAR